MKCWIWVLLLATAFAQSNSATATGREWTSYTESVKSGYALGFINGAAVGAVREMILCAQLVNISLGIVNDSIGQFKGWKEKYPEIVATASSQMLKQTDRPEFKQDFCVKSFNSGFENITVGQFVRGVNAFYTDYRNQAIPVNYAFQYVRNDINGKSQTDLNAELLWERRCIADPKTCTESKPDSAKP